MHTVPDEAQGLALLPVGGIDAVLDPDAVVDFAGSAAGRPFYNSDRNNFAPNIGVARQLTDKLVVRGGYSLNYVLDNNLTTVANAFGNNEGLSQTVALPGLSGTVSGGGLVPVETPEFNIPRTARDGILADPHGRPVHVRSRPAHAVRPAVERRAAVPAPGRHRGRGALRRQPRQRSSSGPSI